MNHKQTPTRDRALTIMHAVCATLATLAIVPAAQAQVTDISPNPLTTSSPNQVKPNLMFILDDSGSMSRDYMPDDANFDAATKYGRSAAQCNGLAYNPTVTYNLPVDSTGANLAAGTYTFPLASALNNVRTINSAAPTIGTGSFTVTTGSNGPNNGTLVTLYSNSDQSLRMIGTVTAGGGTSTLTVNVTETQGSGTLTNPRMADGDNRPFYFTYSGSSAPLSYTYNASGLITTTDFYKDCNTNIGSNPASGATFTKVVVTPSNITQNYRNWYTYYRTRILMAQTAASLAFRSIDDTFRVGFTTISSPSVSGTNFLDVADFNATQKSSFYTSLNAASPGPATPLRGALSKAGKYYAKKAALSNGNAQTYDPVQFSCQKNFAILTTDGYWNTRDEVNSTGTDSYGPDQLDNTDVGQQDGAGTPRPMLDGAFGVTQSRTSSLQRRTTQWQTGTVMLQQRTGHLQERTRANSSSPWTGWSDVNSCTWDTSGGSRRDCQYNWGGWSNAASCTTSNSEGSGTGGGTTWNIANGTACQYTTPVWTNTASCTASSPPPSAGSPYTVASATVCNLSVSAWTNVSSCTVDATTECRYSPWTAWTNIASCTAAAQSTASPYTVGTATECQSSTSGGSSNSLADVAMYYYNTDLRDGSLNNCTLANGTNVCTNNVPPRGTDTAIHQHMSTFTVGLGVNGTLGYADDYLTGGSADYQAIIQGTKDWPIPTASSTGGSAENIDDLWHAAVNGRGKYFSARDPSALARSLSDALAAIQAQTGAGSGAAASTLQPVAGDNALFIAKYTSAEWTGDLVSRSIDPQSGVISTTDAWSAMSLLDSRVAAGTA
ncbi:MAG: hypothetical protein OEW27_12735, partial [Aquincola sp.]|nr:hypothetical protein [Aquincola sp.]